MIVPVRNGSKHLARCLEALGRSEYGQFEVIVVDDCSTDNTPQIAERYTARCLRTPRTLGPGGARNLGAQHAGGEILVFVDSDVVMPPGALNLIAEDFRRDPELAAVFGSYDDTPPWTTFISQYKNLMHHYVHQASSESAATFWAGCGAVRKTVFEEFSGFDAATYTVPSIEDIALGLEMVRRDAKSRLDKRLAVKHLKRWTVRNLLRADIFYRAIPWTRLILNTRHLPRDLNLTYASRASSLLVGLLAVGCVLLPFSLSGWIGIRPVLLLGSMAFISLLLLISELGCLSIFPAQAWLVVCRRGRCWPTGLTTCTAASRFFSARRCTSCASHSPLRARRACATVEKLMRNSRDGDRSTAAG